MFVRRLRCSFQVQYIRSRRRPFVHSQAAVGQAVQQEQLLQQQVNQGQQQKPVAAFIANDLQNIAVPELHVAGPSQHRTPYANWGNPCHFIWKATADSFVCSLCCRGPDDPHTGSQLLAEKSMEAEFGFHQNVSCYQGDQYPLPVGVHFPDLESRPLVVTSFAQRGHAR